jgi:hypothetical protein
MPNAVCTLSTKKLFAARISFSAEVKLNDPLMLGLELGVGQLGERTEPERMISVFSGDWI